jgi:uncharacterized protein YebE (UPF0316 family)
MMFDTWVINWIWIPLAIFLCRVIDVTLGTMKVIYVTQGNRMVAPILGFVETFIWLVAISQVMKNLTTWTCYAAWAGGYAAGVFAGITAVRFFSPRKLSIQSTKNIFAPYLDMK